MKLSRLQIALVLSLASAGILHADLVLLKDGKQLEGTILEETATGVRMKYKVTPKIWDEKIIPLTDIAANGILKEKPEEVEIKDLRKLLPTQDLMTAEKYEQLIQDRLRPFVNRYPGTKEAAEVSKMIEEVTAEKEKVVAGGLKMEGKWLDPTAARAEKFNIDAFAIRQAMNEKAAAGDYSGAMKEFERLADRRASHFASTYYPQAVQEAIAHLTSYDTQLARMIKDQPVLQKLRDDNLKRLIEPDLSRTKSAIDREVDEAKNRYDLERKETKWITPYKYNLKQLQELSKHVFTVKTQLQKIDIPAITKINEHVAQATRHYYAGKIVEGEYALLEVIKLASNNQDYANLIAQYRQGFATKRYELATKTGVTQAAALGSGSAAVAGTNAPGTDDAVARALAMAGGNATGQPGVVPPAGVPVQPGVVPQPGVMPQPGVVPQVAPNPYGQPQVAPGGVPPAAGVPPAYGAPGTVPGAAVAPNPYAQPAPNPYAQAAPVAPVPEETGFGMNNILMIAGGAVVLVLLIAIASNKKKK
ncbi:MAG: hypothetical protein JNG86_15530 [Verrucomicrobiaceae bacterium]|nr:hypothetical protein [Verrucomicrobiaceae bacterium]